MGIGSNDQSLECRENVSPGSNRVKTYVDFANMRPKICIKSFQDQSVQIFRVDDKGEEGFKIY